MIVEALGKKYKIGFTHDPAECCPGSVCPRSTECIISELVKVDGKMTRVDVVRALSKCHAEDQFSRERGRKISLTRALQKMYPSNIESDACHNKRLRQQFWTAYLSR